MCWSVHLNAPHRGRLDRPKERFHGQRRRRDGLRRQSASLLASYAATASLAGEGTLGGWGRAPECSPGAAYQAWHSAGPAPRRMSMRWYAGGWRSTAAAARCDSWYRDTAQWTMLSECRRIIRNARVSQRAGVLGRYRSKRHSCRLMRATDCSLTHMAAEQSDLAKTASRQHERLSPELHSVHDYVRIAVCSGRHASLQSAWGCERHAWRMSDDREVSPAYNRCERTLNVRLTGLDAAKSCTPPCAWMRPFSACDACLHTRHIPGQSIHVRPPLLRSVRDSGRALHCTVIAL
jgi:hypothetical protein